MPGANVFTPRERDTQKQEVIVDNDGNLSGYGGQGSLYLEVKSRKARWQQTSPTRVCPTEESISR